MDRKKQNLLEMRKLGFSTQTTSLLSESQIKMILEKIKKNKKETKEAVTPLAEPAKTKFKVDKAGGNLPANPSGKGYNMTSNPDGTMTATPMEENKKKNVKKYNPWAVCTASVGRKNKKKYEDCVMGVKKKLKEGKSPYEYIIESKIEEIVENNLSPKLSKQDLLRIIAEKKSMMKKPIGKMTSIKGETMEASTETAPVKAPPKTKPDTRPSHPGRKDKEQPNPKPRAGTETAPVKAPPKTKPDTRPSHPGRKDKEQPNPKPRASSSEMESKKSEIITAIFNLIDKENK
jgi:hypothetical protein